MFFIDPSFSFSSQMFDTELITIPPRPFMPSWLEEDQEDQEIEFELDDEDS